jgi:predicted Ser/Thr protein kinase
MCGSKLPADAPAGLCPQCLLKQGFESGVGADSASRGATIIGVGFVPPAPDELAQHFPQLEILELIGKGGMGAVYKARQPALDRIVALKILPPEVGTDPAFAERFTREARALAKLSHQNIVAVYDFGKTSVPDAESVRDASRDGLYYFLMEYVDGANLRQLIKSGGTQPAEALAIVPQICEALEFAHGEGVVHRDIKPENILVDQKGRVKIADFGLAKLLQAEPVGVTLTQAGQVMGTWYYMAPEQIERPLEVDHRADIYSLGVVFYEMLTGHVPSGRFDPPSKTAQIDVRLDEVVLRALEREPSRRYQHASDVKTQVESICGMPHAAVQRVFGREFRSKTTLFGWPLVHIAFGLDPRTGRSRTAKGIIAIGDRAVGGIAIGGAAAGGIAIGGAAVGLLSLGGVSLGVLMAIGGLALGGLAFGGLAVGVVAIGGGAIGLYAYGGTAFGLHALGANARDPQAVEFFTPWVGNWMRWLAAIGLGMPLFGVLLWGVIWLVFYRQGRTGGASSRREAADVALLPVRGPGVGLVVTGIVNWIGIPIAIAVLLYFAAGTEAGGDPFILLMMVALTALLASSLMIAAGLLMMRQRAYWLCVVGSLLALIVTPGNLIGLPIGIWALVVLSQRDVRQAFRARRNPDGDSDEPTHPPSTLTRAWNDWWSQRDRTFTAVAKTILLVLYVIGLWTFFSSEGSGRAEAFRHTIGQPSPWFVVEKDSAGFRWHITLNSWAWLVALATFGCYYAWYRIRLTEQTRIGRFETPPAQVVFWGVIAFFAIALAMSPLFLF